MKPLALIRVLFAVAALYDGLLGLAFIVNAPGIFLMAGITPPNHWGYVHFAAGLLLVFGWMFLRISLRPVEERNLIPFGVLLKVCYVATVCWHWYGGGIPDMWKWFAAADTLFAILFLRSISIVATASEERKQS